MLLSGGIVQNMASLRYLTCSVSLFVCSTMGVVRLELIILQKMTYKHIVFRIFNEQIIQKQLIILDQLGLRAYFLSFTKFMNYSG